MAKMYGLGGVLSGKLGNTVLAIYNGVQVARQYQPVVSNPKSSLQQFQRAKANLVGRVSQITPWQVLMGLGNSKRTRRSRYLKILMNNATSGYEAGSATEISSKLAPTDIIFSEGALFPVFLINTVAANATSVDITVTRRAGVSDDEFNASGVMFVGIIMQSNGNYESVLYKSLAGADASVGQNTISLTHVSEGAYTVLVYVIPFATTDGANLTTKTEQLTGDGTGLSAILTTNPAAVPVNWGQSMYISQMQYTPGS